MLSLVRVSSESGSRQQDCALTSVQVELDMRVLLSLGAVVVRSSFDTAQTCQPMPFSFVNLKSVLHLHVLQLEPRVRCLWKHNHARSYHSRYRKCHRRKEPEDSLDPDKAGVHFR